MFRRVATISLPCAPDQLFHSRGRVFATCRDGRAMLEIDVENLRVVGRIGLPGKPVAARLLPDTHRRRLVLTEEPDAAAQSRSGEAAGDRRACRCRARRGSGSEWTPCSRSRFLRRNSVAADVSPRTETRRRHRCWRSLRRDSVPPGRQDDSGGRRGCARNCHHRCAVRKIADQASAAGLAIAFLFQWRWRADVRDGYRRRRAGDREPFSERSR